VFSSNLKKLKRNFTKNEKKIETAPNLP